MSFKENSCQQISIADSFAGLTAREQKALEKSWAKVFADEIYHQRSTDAETRMKQLLEDADKLLESCISDLEEVTEYELFVRCLTEQTTVEDSVRRLHTKEDGTMNSTALQNSSDPEATYRSKGGRSYRGYTANIEESVGKNASVITDYRYGQNIHSDSSFLKEHLEQMARQEETISLITDGAYSGTDNAKLAENKNVELITTSLVGRDAPDILADFEFNEEGTQVLKCPAGYEPKSCTYMKPINQCRVSFDRNHCAGCPYQDKCKPKIYKKVAKLVTSKMAHERAKIQRKMQTDEYKAYARLRNGIETIPSNLRNNYHLDKLPRGKQRGKFFFGGKITALNFRKLFNFLNGLGNYAQNPILI